MTNDHPASTAPHNEHVKDVSPKDSTLLGFGFALDLGYTIAIPAVLFGLGGGYLDKMQGTSPLFLLLGIFFAFVISFTIVWRKVKEIMDRMPKPLPKKKKDPVDADIAREQEALHDLFRPQSDK